MNREQPHSKRRQRWLYCLAWIVAMVVIVVRQVGCRLSFEDDKTWFWDRLRSQTQPFVPFELPHYHRHVADPESLPRGDGNSAHIQIDFGGQWVLARMLTTGHGRELYNRAVQRQVVDAAYPWSDEVPGQKVHDADDLMSAFMGEDDSRRRKAIRFGMGMLANDWPIRTACGMESGGAAEDIATPPRELGAGLGGPLYPPLEAFYFAPYAIGNEPLKAYFTHQYVLMVCTIIGGLGISIITRGRIWWPVAIVLILLFSGTRPNFELGQNAPITLMILIVGWAFRSRGMPVAGGLFWGLLAYKPVWAMSYFFALLLLREFRMAAAMVGVGVLLGLLTLPWVGLHSWFDWLKIGSAASELYALDATWIPLSRDLFGLPRRLLTDFRAPIDERFSLAAHLAGWLLWLAVLELTLRVFFCGRRSPYREPFVLLAAWLLTYHFIYYDAAIACLPFLLLWDVARGDESLKVSRFRFPTKCYFVLFLLEYAVQPLNIKATFVCERYAHEVLRSDGENELYPRLLLTFDEWGPWNTLVLIVVWAWCGLRILRSKRTG